MIQIDKKQIQAALLFAAKKDIRYYLNAVLVETTPGETRLVATDGHALLVQRYAAVNAETVSVVIPRDVLEGVKGGGHIVGVRDALGWSLIDGNTRTAFTPTDGQYLDYRRLLRATKAQSGDTSAGHFNPEFLVKYQKAARILGSKEYPFIRQAGEKNGAFVTTQGLPDFLGVIMPCRLGFSEKSPDEGIPAWAFE